jgi:hypothetical protein
MEIKCQEILFHYSQSDKSSSINHPFIFATGYIPSPFPERIASYVSGVNTICNSPLGRDANEFIEYGRIRRYLFIKYTI